MRADPSAWIPTLLLIAALALLPMWLVGSAALGAALVLWVICLARRKPPKHQVAEANTLDRIQPNSHKPNNVIPLRRSK